MCGYYSRCQVRWAGPIGGECGGCEVLKMAALANSSPARGPEVWAAGRVYVAPCHISHLASSPIRSRPASEYLQYLQYLKYLQHLQYLHQDRRSLSQLPPSDVLQLEPFPSLLPFTIPNRRKLPIPSGWDDLIKYWDCICRPGLRCTHRLRCNRGDRGYLVSRENFPLKAQKRQFYLKV